MMALLMTGVVKVEKVYQAGTFLIEIMSLMFIPAAVGIIESWDQLHRNYCTSIYHHDYYDNL